LTHIVHPSLPLTLHWVSNAKFGLKQAGVLLLSSLQLCISTDSVRYIAFAKGYTSNPYITHITIYQRHPTL